MAGIGDSDRDVDAGVAVPVEAQTGPIQDFVDGYLVPVDPSDAVQCESCQ
ncbi:hypothetical protein GCM10009617_36640 [Leifsonia poae]